MQKAMESRPNIDESLRWLTLFCLASVSLGTLLNSLLVP